MQVGLKPIVQEWGKDVYKATVKKNPWKNGIQRDSFCTNIFVSYT